MSPKLACCPTGDGLGSIRWVRKGLLFKSNGIDYVFLDETQCRSAAALIIVTVVLTGLLLPVIALQNLPNQAEASTSIA